MPPSAEQTIWALLTEASQTLPEPFSRAALISWISKRRPDVELSSISTHIQYAILGTPNRSAHPLGSRVPLLERVDRGLYRRLPDGPGPQAVAAECVAPRTSQVASQVPTADAAPTKRVLLVGCSQTKAPTAAPAGELFRGPGFRKASEYARRSGESWFVLSAKYGLLHPDDVVGPYDVHLGTQSAEYRAVWGEWVVAQLDARLPLGGVVIETHASEAYCAPLADPLDRAGAVLQTPLAGLGQGQRLAWAGYRSSSTETAGPVWDVLIDAARSVPPVAFLASGREGLDVPGLYSWWVDDVGADQLSRGMGQPLRAGLLYAGKAGGERAGSSPSASTLWSRIAGNHLRGNVRSSTLRKSLAALLGAEGPRLSEADLTAWMLAHLRVSALPVPSARVAELEDELVAHADPPLNLAGVERSPARIALTRLRGLISR